MTEQIHHSPVITETGHPISSFPVVLARMVNVVFGIIIAFIVVRMVLLVLGANQGNGFVDLVYGISSVFVAPFYGIFNNTPTYGSVVFDLSSVVAIIVYALVDWGIVATLTIGTDHRETV